MATYDNLFEHTPQLKYSESSTMLSQIRTKHHPWIKDLIIDGARSGAYGGQLLGPAADIGFFDGLWVGLATGWLTPPGSGTQKLHGFLYSHEDSTNSQPDGFALVLDDPDAPFVELWMTSLDKTRRGIGLGKTMLSEVTSQFSTRYILVRCNRDSDSARAVLLRMRFYELGSGSEGTRFLVSPNTPPAVRSRIKTALLPIR